MVHNYITHRNYFFPSRFTVYKLPRLDKSAHHYVSEGLGYVYMDNQTKRFLMPDKSIKSNVSATGQTLQQIYGTREIAYVMYNDETPAGIRHNASLQISIKLAASVFKVFSWMETLNESLFN